jgi:class 3 adenylate cyclase
MVDTALCPTLIGRDEQLFVLEDALLAAHGGESRSVALGGEAGMGKTRLARVLAQRSERLGWDVLWGACSEAELALPYLPVVEALGNYLSRNDPQEIAQSLGPAARELAQLFPQLGPASGDPIGEPMQAKLRLFEAVVALVSRAARETGVLLVVEDVHWADSATRELLDHLVRRLTKTRSLLLMTYRSDELDRRHPLAPLVQTWRRSGAVEIVGLTPLDRGETASMLAAILGSETQTRELGDLLHARAEGNPFIVEEMLKEALERGGHVWNQDALESVRIPETVRDTILLRFGRLDGEAAGVLEVAAVLGRRFDYATLLAVSSADEEAVQRAVAVGIAQQLLEQPDETQLEYGWRHALTQEAVVDEVVLPRRQQIHGRAADALAGAGADAMTLARHLLGAARFEDAVPVCIVASDEAEASLAFGEALELIERALPHVRDPLVRSRLLARMGRLVWMDGHTGAAETILAEACAGLEAAGQEFEAARSRLILARCQWEESRPAEAHEQFERARAELERHGPSAELAVAYMRLAGLYKFEFDDVRSAEAARRAVDVATDSGADFERIWSSTWLAFALFDQGHTTEALVMLDEAFEEARSRGYLFIAHNMAYNEAFTRLHTMLPGVSERVETLAAEPGPPVITDMVGIAASWGLRAGGQVPAALDAIENAAATSPPGASEKVRWRTRVEHAEVLFELGRLGEAAAIVPPPVDRAELQDVVYDAAVQIRIRLATDRIDEAIALAREIAVDVARFAPYFDVVDVAVEAFVAGNLGLEAQAMVDAARNASTDVGTVFLDAAQGRIFLAAGAAGRARPILATVVEESASRGFRLFEWRARLLLAGALAQEGQSAEAEGIIATVVSDADASGAVRVAQEARSLASRFRLSMPEPKLLPERFAGDPELVPGGERVVTSLFADVRGYSQIAASTAPADLADRVGSLHRWAAAEVVRHHGLVDKFAGDAVMATFNATGTRLDHATHALEAAIALAGKATLLELGVGVGIAVGPAVVATTVDGGNVSVLGTTTNLAARLQGAAAAGEIVLSEDTYRRVASWLAERGLDTTSEALELKGFEQPQPARRLRPA